MAVGERWCNAIKVGATTPIQSGWTGFTNAALVVDPAGLRAFWGGFRATDSSDPQRETNTALSEDGGASWMLQPGQQDAPLHVIDNHTRLRLPLLPRGPSLSMFSTLVPSTLDGYRGGHA